MKSSSTVLTPHGAKYMNQLVKHFGHRVPTSLDDREGKISFEAGEIYLRAAPPTLMIQADAAEPEGLDRLESVIASHLKRFAFREPDLAVEWSRPA